jgi:5'/3'-nucleotidase
MNKANFCSAGSRPLRKMSAILLVSAMALVLNGCYWAQSVRDYQRNGSMSWWCLGGTPALNQQQCYELSAWMDFGTQFAYQYPTRQSFSNAGASHNATFSAALPQMGEPSVLGDTTTFSPASPNVLYFDGVDSSARPLAVGWAVDDTGGGPPDGLPGDRDVWTLHDGKYWLAMWVLRGHENHPDIFTTAHPCVAAGESTLTATTDDCFVASHTQPLEIMVVNDDGIGAHGIDALVEGLYDLPNVVINIVAPATNQSGGGDARTQGPYVISGSAATTLSGRVATAVYSNDPRNGGAPLVIPQSGRPADATIYGLQKMLLSPDLILSGINDGQNYGNIGASLSGTVGAARWAVRNLTPAIATSQGGVTVTPNFPAGVTATLALVEKWRLGLAGQPFMTLPNINIPTCAAGLSPRGTLDTVVKQLVNGGTYFFQDCAAIDTVVNNDQDAFNKGYISIADMGLDTPPNWP